MAATDSAVDTDVLVIGGGPGGYAAAIRAGQLDLDVTLVEMDAYGGTCLNRGCIPSKALLHGTGLAHAGSNAGEMGIEGELSVDLSAMVAWKDGVVDQLTDGVERLCEASGATLVPGRGVFTGPHEARVEPTDDGPERTVSFENAIVATGSRPIEIPGFAFAEPPVIDSAGALALEAPPERLLVVGAGYIGMELSTVFARLGTTVDVVEMEEEVLPGFPADLTEPVRRNAEGLGVSFHLGQVADEWREASDGIVVVTEDGDGERHEHPADRVLVAVGRAPVTDTLDLDALGLGTDDRGFIETDEQTRTAIEHVFAVGDVAGEPMLAHKGMVEGEVAAEVIAGEPAAMDGRVVPAAVFTEPEIATVGMSPEAAEEAGIPTTVGRFPFQASGRALSMAEPDGFVRIVADAEQGFVIGGQIVGPEAAELVAEVTLAIEMGARLEDLVATVHTHPTLAEAVREAAAGALGQAIHAVNR